MPRQSTMKQTVPPSMQCSWVYVLHLLPGMRLALSVRFVQPVTSLEKTNFFLLSGYQLGIASGLGLGTCVHFPSSLELHPA